MTHRWAAVVCACRRVRAFSAVTCGVVGRAARVPVRVTIARCSRVLRVRNSGFVAFERREDAEKAMNALADSNLENRTLKLMWAKAVKVSSGASGTTGTAVIVNNDLILDQKGAAGGRRRGEPLPTLGGVV